MSHKIIHRTLASIVTTVSALQFITTAQPTVSFWDPGELSAAAYLLQVPHPPGGPLFSLVGRFFYLLPIPGNIGLRMNMVSVVASVFSVLFFYLIAVRLIEIFKGKTPQDAREAWGTYLSAGIGALAFSFSDTFWFSGVEANYFAASTFLFSSMTWLMLVWYGQSDQPGNTRYLLLIAYMIGLSAGVHLMSVLTIFTVVMVFVFRHYVTDDDMCKQTAYILLGHIALLLIVTYGMWSTLTSQQAPTPQEFRAYDRKFLGIMGGISVAIAAVFWKKVFQRNSIYLPITAASIAMVVAYPGVIKKLPELIHTLSGNNSGLGVCVLLILLGCLGYLAYWTGKHQKPLLRLCTFGILFIILGFSTYATIITRANQHPPMNENDPNSFSSLLTYLNREQYGEFPIFKRRWTAEAIRQRTFTNYSSDFDFFWRYQTDHMFNRYLFFNFIGRSSRDQDSDWAWRQLYGIPFLIGLFGLYFHFRKDWRMATSFLILFVIMGYLIAFYQNQQEPQPRERDYFYAGAFFVFSLWIALGIRGLLDLANDLLNKPRSRTIAFAGVLMLGALFIPGRMFQTNYYTHDRSKNWFPWDYAYNLLQTCEKNAILFTNGDNDTFPLWYLQDVEGVRRDVRVICLSLINTPWYIQQMKEKPYYPEAKAVPISLSDSRIAGLTGGLIPWQPQKVVIPVPREAIKQYGVTDTAFFNRETFGRTGITDADTEGTSKIEFLMRNTMQLGELKAIRTQDYMVKHIIETNRWNRPVYFASTCPPDSRIGIDEYLRLCGLAWRLEPFKAAERDMGIDPQVLEASLFNEPGGFSQSPHYGYKFRSIADSSVSFDENESRLTVNLRIAFRVLAIYHAEIRKDREKSVAVLDRMESVIPMARFPMPIDQGFDFALIYYRLGQFRKSDEVTSMVEQQFKSYTEGGRTRNPYLYRAMLQLYDIRKEYRKSLDLLNGLALLYPNDPSIRQSIDSVEARLKRSSSGGRP